MTARAPRAHSVLVVEDTDGWIKIVKDACSRLGLVPVTVKSFNAAIKLVMENPGRFCLVLVDLKIPLDDEPPSVPNGLALVGRLRDIEKNRDILPIIVITAEDSQKYIKRAMQLGANDYANKPFDDDDETLDDRLRRWVQQGCERRNPLGCPNEAKPKRAAKAVGPAEPAPTNGRPRIVLDGKPQGRRSLVLVNGHECWFRDKQFDDLCTFAIALRAGKPITLEEAGGYNGMRRIREELLKARVAPEVVKGIIVQVTIGRFRLDLPRDHVQPSDELKLHRPELASALGCKP